MNDDELIDAGRALADLLDAENAALMSVDLARAAAMGVGKARAVERLTQAQAAMRGPVVATRAVALRAITLRLEAAAAENRQLLARAIIVQRRVIEGLVRATPRGAPRYGATGAVTTPLRGDRPVALLARA